MKTNIIDTRSLPAGDLVFEILKNENNLSNNTYEELFPDLVNPVNGLGAFYRLSELKATSIFIDAISKIPTDSKICIMGDYDCDGIMGTSILVCSLRKLGYNVDFWIPDRLIDGYGMNLECLNESVVASSNVLITVDNGISAKDVVEKARELGKTVIVTDHHLPTEGLVPENTVIVDPKYNGDDFSDICGATVALKLMYALFKSRGVFFPLEDMMPLAGIATVADMMPMLGENRYLVKETLRQIDCSKFRKNFLRKFLYGAGCYNFLTNNQSIASEGLISFQIAPTVNAVSRMTGDVTEFVKEIINCYETGSDIRSRGGINNSRKRMTTDLTDSLDSILENSTSLCEVITYREKDFEQSIKGVIGLVANRICDQYSKPTLVGIITENADGTIDCDLSGRSVPAFNLHSAIENIKLKHPELNISGGGHAAAMGIHMVGVTEDDVTKLQELLNEEIRNSDTPEPIRNVYILNTENEPEIISGLLKYAPFGPGLKNPLFYHDGCYSDVENSKTTCVVGDYYFKKLSTVSLEDGCPAETIFNINFEEIGVATFRIKSLKEVDYDNF